MHSLRITCPIFLIPAVSTLNIPFQDSITISPNPPTPPNLSFELLSPSNQSTPSSWSNTSFPPTHPSPLASNTSALQALGLDPQEPISWTKAPSGAVIGVQCNIRYGRRLDFQDCRDAYGYIARADERVVRFAQRHAGLPHDVALPLRFLGSKGKCAINPEIIDPYSTATASTMNIADAAYALIERCAPRSGGIAVDIGGDNHLAVLLQPYTPTVLCEDAIVPSFPRDSCAWIEQGMEADERRRVFGDERLDPTVQEPLPLQLVSRDVKCVLRISSTTAADTDIETWYHLWEATVALNAMCVRVGKRGSASRLGERKHLMLRISD